MYSGGATHIPLRVNSAGVIPIIFAISILLLPSQVAQYFTNSDTEWLKNLSTGIVNAFQNTVLYNGAYFVLVVAFTFFYTAFTFVPNDVADNIKRYGGFIPGIRPGRPTAEFLGRVVTRITIAGALFLGSWPYADADRRPHRACRRSASAAPASSSWSASSSRR